MAEALGPRRGCRVIGVGNRDRGDDAVGPIVAERLKARKIEGLDIFEEGGDAGRLIASFESAARVFLVDAALSRGSPGRIRRFDIASAPLPRDIATLSTHGFGLAEAIELARALKRLPVFCVVYTIDVADCVIGAPLSLAIAAAATEVVARLCAEIGVP